MARDLCNVNSTVKKIRVNRTREARIERQKTHERPHAFPEHVHRHAQDPAARLARGDGEEGTLDSSGEDDAVGEERRAVDEDAHRGLGERDDVRGVRAVRVDHVRDACRVRDDDAEVGHPMVAEGARKWCVRCCAHGMALASKR